jgi:FkbM family methyltransferase
MSETKPASGRWRLWHPFQGLWNRDLITRLREELPRPSYRLALGAIVAADTALLFARAVRRRHAKLGLSRLFSRAHIPKDVPVVYFDLGTHREAKELQIVAKDVLPRVAEKFAAYGFEASVAFFAEASEHFAGDEHVTMVNAAVCDDLPEGGKLRLYKADAARGSASLYRDHYGGYEEVDATKFSEWIAKTGIDVDNSICIMRMNIEGAELDVIRDLVRSGLSDKITAFYGMWDDVGKIDPVRGATFLALLADNGIDPFTFNGRDVRLGLRRKCIEYDLSTSLQEGLDRVRRRRAGER